LRIAYSDLFKPDAWAPHNASRAILMTLITSVILWLPAAGVMGYNILNIILVCSAVRMKI